MSERKSVEGLVVGLGDLKKEPVEDGDLKEEPLKHGSSQSQVKLFKDRKPISRVKCIDPPRKMPRVWNITSIVRRDAIDFLSGLPGFRLRADCEDLHQEKEWGTFLGFLRTYKKVAISDLGFYEVYVFPHENSEDGHATVLYKASQTNTIPGEKCNVIEAAPAVKSSSSPLFLAGEAAMSNTDVIDDVISPEQQYAEVIGSHSFDLKAKGGNGPRNTVGVPSGSVERNLVTVHPSYLKTLGQAHSGWIFGAIAELVDNARDAKATKLEIAINMVYSKIAGKEIPMLALIDDGCGMNHTGILRMISFGHIQAEVADTDCIGRYGIGFKTGAMRLGKDALVLTQTSNSRSIAFLSQTMNEGRDNLEIPVVSYHRVGQHMEVDKSIQNEESARYNLKIIKEFSPFDKYFIGEKAGLFKQNGTGTQIYIWNLDKWGSDYSLKWENGMAGGSSFHQGGIFTRSRRIRSRPGQISQAVPLDYSLASYLEVIFLDPRMKIYVQGALVQSRPLAKSLNKTIIEKGEVLGKPVQLILGRCQLELEQANCGIFLYWHGRLIEGYKRVGSMVHNGDRGRGIIGVIEVSDLMKCWTVFGQYLQDLDMEHSYRGCDWMDDGSEHAWVHNNKQGFQDCEAYAELEKWLGEKADQYIDTYVDRIPLKKGNPLYKPDHEWVQCDKCRKWRKLSTGIDSRKLPAEWFCYMTPFSGQCEMPEEKASSGLITISTQRRSYLDKDPPASGGKSSGKAMNEKRGGCSDSDGDSSSNDESEESPVRFTRKRKRASLKRSCKKG